MRSVQVGVDGSVFGVTTQQGIVCYNGTNLNIWQALPGHVKSLAITSSNLVIGTSYIAGIFSSLHLFSHCISRKYSFTDSNVLKMINFGAPYSANDAFYDFFTNGLATGVAVINKRDLVPYLSVLLYAWRRMGTQYILHNPNYPALVDTLYSHQVSDHVHSLCSTLIT